jgi:hypothetical protein
MTMYVSEPMIPALDASRDSYTSAVILLEDATFDGMSDTMQSVKCRWSRQSVQRCDLLSKLY